MAAKPSFQPPEPEEVSSYAKSIGFALDGGYFLDYWETRGWMVRPGIKMSSWKAAVRNWKRLDAARNQSEFNSHNQARNEAALRRKKIIRESAERIVALSSWMESQLQCPWCSDPADEIEREKLKMMDHFGKPSVAELSAAVNEIKHIKSR